MDWIDDFMTYTDGIPSPEIFRLWSAISTIAGALERRVWITTARNALFPNLFLMLVSPPAVGKTQAIMNTQDLWHAMKKLKVAPSSVTKASLIDAISSARQNIPLANGKGLIEYSSLQVASSEFGVLVPKYDMEFLSVLTDIYDCPRVYRETRRTLNKEIDIHKPQLNFIAGTQPGFLASLLPEEAWNQGFMSRVIMIYSAQPVRVSLFEALEPRQDLFKSLVERLVSMTKLYGGFLLDDDAKHELERWARTGMDPIPEHSKLQNYCGRRVLHILKLTMIAAISRSGELRITLEDVNRARDWLLSAEQTMPDVFREMTQRSDNQVIQELHFFMWKLWLKDKKPLHESRLIHFLSARVPSEKVQRVLDVAEKSNIVAREAGTQLYIPRPAHEHGME